MQKIPTMFVRDETVKGHPVTPQIKPECQWVLDGEGYATPKYDGTNVKIEGGRLFKRQKPKDRDYDEASYVRCDRDNSADRWAFEAFDRNVAWLDGIYELIGPKVQGNPHGVDAHMLIYVAPDPRLLQIRWGVGPRTFEGLQNALAEPGFRWEGLVFHHPDGRMAKIKRRDFGLPWPAK